LVEALNFAVRTVQHDTWIIPGTKARPSRKPGREA
jgi:hypothetical protein